MKNTQIPFEAIDSESYFTAAHGANVAPWDIGFWSTPEEREKAKHTEIPEVLGSIVFCVLVLKDGKVFIGSDATGVDSKERRERAFLNAVSKGSPR